jgi:nicotinate-nucleotide adenylyltransferase
LPTWHRWQELGDLAHLVVLTRPGEAGEEPQALIDWSKGRIDHDLKQVMSSSAGRISMLTLAQLPISASKIREFIARGEEVSDLVPESVNRYIQMQHLYLDVATQLEH